MRSSRSKTVAALAVAVVLAVVLVLAARLENRRDVHAQTRGMRSVLRLVGPLDNPSLSGYRVFPSAECLTYRRGTNPFALEVCSDRTGRVLEAFDRRDVDHRRIWSLGFAPGSATVRVDPATVQRLLRKMGAAT